MTFPNRTKTDNSLEVGLYRELEKKKKKKNYPPSKPAGLLVSLTIKLARLLVVSHDLGRGWKGQAKVPRMFTVLTETQAFL